MMSVTLPGHIVSQSVCHAGRLVSCLGAAHRATKECHHVHHREQICLVIWYQVEILTAGQRQQEVQGVKFCKHSKKSTA